MATTAQEFEAGALNALAAAITDNPGLVDGWISSAESGGQAALVNLAKNLPTVKGALGIIEGPLAQAAMSYIESYVAQFVAQHPAAEVAGLIVTWLQNEAKAVAA